MRVAAGYDIHGNLPALDTVLAEIDRDQFDLMLAKDVAHPGISSIGLRYHADQVAKVFNEIDDKLASWIAEQPLFFVGTAPRDGHVNVSPKGFPGTLRVLGPHAIAYLDTVGSGIETVAHLRENGRIVIMFCAFAGAPRILRLHGTGRVRQIGDPRFEELVEFFDVDAVRGLGLEPALRSVVEVEVERIADSCGYGVPLMEFDGWRPQMRAWAENRLRTQGPNGLMDYSREMNEVSINGLPGIEPALLPDRS